MVLVEQSAVSVSVAAAYRHHVVGGNGRGPVRALERVPNHAAAHGLRSQAALESLDVRVGLTVQTLRAVLLTQAEEAAHLAFVVPQPAPADDGLSLAEYYSPQAVSGRILDFVRNASGGDPERLERLIEAVETAFAEVGAMLDGNVPEVSRQTMSTVREGLRAMLAEFRGESDPQSGAAAVELSAAAIELAAQGQETIVAA